MFGWIGIVAGIILILLGGYMVLFLPFVTQHQEASMVTGGIILGIIFLVLGGILIFF